MKKIILAAICVLAFVLLVSCGAKKKRNEFYGAKNHGSGAFIYGTIKDELYKEDTYGGSFIDGNGDLCICIVTGEYDDHEVKRMEGIEYITSDEAIAPYKSIIDYFGFDADKDCVMFKEAKYSKKNLESIQSELIDNSEELLIDASYIDEKNNKVVVLYTSDEFDPEKVIKCIGDGYALLFCKTGSLEED